MNKCVIDTNVFIKAAISPADLTGLDLECANACADFIKKCRNSTDIVVVLDSGNEILKEYAKHLNLSGQPSLATDFFIWVCTLVSQEYIYITKNSKKGYDEFPDNADLAKFDKSDRKFIAVAKTHHENPTIFQGSDSKWWGFKDALKEEGILVNFLCEQYIKAHYTRKIKS